MTKSLAHLLDHDLAIINKAELIIDRLLEILEISELMVDKIRDQLVNFISIKLLLTLIAKATPDIQEEAKSKLKELNVEFYKKVAQQFDKQTLESDFNSSVKIILEEKYQELKPSITLKQSAEIEELLQLVGKN